MKDLAPVSSLLALILVIGLAATACSELMPQRSEGETLWRKRCADCHGLDAAGNTAHYMGNPNADLLDDSWEYGGDDGSVRLIIIEGITGACPSNTDLTEEEIGELVKYLRELRRAHN